MNKENQIYLSLKTKIEDELFKVGSVLDSIDGLCKKYSATKKEVLLALNLLLKSGFIKMDNDKYIVVIKRVIRKIDTIDGFSHEVSLSGNKAGSILKTYHLFKAEMLPVLKEKMNLRNEDMIHYIVRIRTINGTAVGISHCYLSPKYMKSIDLKSVENSIYETLTKQGAELRKIKGEMSAHMATEEQMEELDIRNEAMLKDTTYLFDQDNELIEFNEMYFIGSKYSFYYTSGN